MESHQASDRVYFHLFLDANDALSMQSEYGKGKIPKFSNKEKQTFTEGLLKPLMDYRLAIEPLRRKAHSSSPPLPSLSLRDPDLLTTSVSQSTPPPPPLSETSPLDLPTLFDPLGNFTHATSVSQSLPPPSLFLEPEISPLDLLTSFDSLGNFTPHTTPPVSHVHRPRPQPRPGFNKSVTFTQLPDELLPYPYLSQHISTFVGDKREHELHRILSLTGEERALEDSNIEAQNSAPAADNIESEFLFNPASSMYAALDTTLPFDNYKPVPTATPICSQPSRAARILSNYTTPTRYQTSSTLAPALMFRTSVTAAPLSLSRQLLSIDNDVFTPTRHQASSTPAPILMFGASATATHSSPSHQPLNMDDDIFAASNPPSTTSLPTSAPLAIRAIRTIPLTAHEVTKLPVWLKSWYTIVEKKPYGESWLTLIHRWPLLEKAYGLISPVRLFKPPVRFY